MRISITVAHHTWPEGPHGTAAHLERVARTADEIGVDTLWVADRLLPPGLHAAPDLPDGPAGGSAAGTAAGSTPAAADGAAYDESVLEAYTTLGFVAARSERVGLGAFASPVTYRAPGLLVKAVTTLDVLSGGRARLGVAAGYAEPEAAAMGLPMPPLTGRLERVEDLLRLAHQMWAGDDSPFLGRHTEVARPHTAPLPLVPTHPPVTVAGHGESRMLPLAAHFADAVTFLDLPAGGGTTLRRKLDLLALHCHKIGRPLSDLDISATLRYAADATAAELTARCAELASLGIGHAVLAPDGPWTPEAMKTLAEAAPAIRATGDGPDPAAPPVSAPEASAQAAAEARSEAGSEVAYLDAYRPGARRGSALGFPVRTVRPARPLLPRRP